MTRITWPSKPVRAATFRPLLHLVKTFDAADLAAESAFWAGLLGGEVYADDDFYSVIIDGKWRFGVQLAPNHVLPEWPDGVQQQQVHLDLHVEDIGAAHEHAISLGARLLRAADNLDTEEGPPGLRGRSRAPVLPRLAQERARHPRLRRDERLVGRQTT